LASSNILAWIFTGEEFAQLLPPFRVAVRNLGKARRGKEKGRKLPPTAPGLRQPPVEGLHSIDFSADRTAHFLLTVKMRGVKQTRSLTASKVFPVGAASGAQAESLFASQDDDGKAGKGL
jgi:hypothetical protein